MRDSELRGRRRVTTEFGLAAAPTAKAPSDQPLRTIYDAGHRTDLPGRKVRAEGDEPGQDATVNRAYAGLGATFDLYLKAYARDSIDGDGLPLDATVHYAENYNNAFWNGEQMVFGDGDGELFDRFTIPVDVIGHELTHGVTQYTANLDYSRPVRAPSTSRCPTSSARSIKQYTLGQTADRGRLADRRGPARAERHGQGAALDEGAGHRVRRRRARQGPAAGDMDDYVRTGARQRRRAHQLRHPQPRLLPGRRRRSAATPGKRPGRSGTTS